ncbi:conserved hypothetical protein [Ricinus communis]|uniref:Uncharacterized protein n=1 Tax=Ricinus communis TaxID=3988 RepID=B9T931_RICCO|nr:conserved hypothetical protein [Ricinus communis]
MRLGDGPADCQPHTHAVRLGRMECLEDPLARRSGNPRPRIRYRQHDFIVLAQLRRDPHRPFIGLHLRQRFDRVHQQVQHQLLQLHPVTLDLRQIPLKLRRQLHLVAAHLAVHQHEHFRDRRVEINPLPARRLLLEERPQTVDHFCRALTVLADVMQRVQRLAYVRRCRAQPQPRRFRIHQHRRHRLPHLMRDRRRQLPHRRHAVRVRQLVLHVPVTPLALARLALGALALRQVQHKRHALLCTTLEGRRAHQHRYMPAIPVTVRRLVRLHRPRLLQLLQRHRVVPLPLQRRQLRYRQPARLQLVTAVPHQPQERVVRVRDQIGVFPDEDPHDVRLHQPTDARLAVPKIAVQPRDLQRDRRLCRQQFQHQRALSGECVRAHPVLQIQHRVEPALPRDRQTEHRPHTPSVEVRVRREFSRSRRIVNEHALARAHHIPYQRLRPARRCDRFLRQHNAFFRRPYLRNNLVAATVRQHQQPPVRPRVVQCDRHQPLDQLRHLRLSRQRLRCLHHRRHVQLLQRRTRRQLRIAVVE